MLESGITLLWKMHGLTGLSENTQVGQTCLSLPSFFPFCLSRQNHNKS